MLDSTMLQNFGKGRFNKG